MTTLKEMLISPFGIKRTTRLWIVFIFSALILLIITLPLFGIPFIDLDSKFIIENGWKWLLSLMAFFTLVWSKFGGM